MIARDNPHVKQLGQSEAIHLRLKERALRVGNQAKFDMRVKRLQTGQHVREELETADAERPKKLCYMNIKLLWAGKAQLFQQGAKRADQIHLWPLFVTFTLLHANVRKERLLHAVRVGAKSLIT